MFLFLNGSEFHHYQGASLAPMCIVRHETLTKDSTIEYTKKKTPRFLPVKIHFLEQKSSREDYSCQWFLIYHFKNALKRPKNAAQRFLYIYLVQYASFGNLH